MTGKMDDATQSAITDVMDALDRLDTAASVGSATVSGHEIFAAALLASTEAENLRGLAPSVLAEEATAALAFLSRKPLGTHKVAVRASKLAGEVAVAAANPRHVIIRTAWVCSADGANFLKTMLRLATERPELRVVDDQHGSPTFAADIAEATAHIAAAAANKTAGAPQFGVFHLVSGGETTWCGFARAIMAASKQLGGPSVPVHAITTADFPTKARRPAYSKLDTSKLARVYGIELPEWDQALRKCLGEMMGDLRA